MAFAGCAEGFMKDGLYYQISEDSEGTVSVEMPEDINDKNEMAEFLNRVETLTIPATVTDDASGKTYRVISVGDGVLKGLPNITTLIISEGIETINGIGACPELSYIEFPETLTAIYGMFTFSETPKLKTIKLPDSLEIVDGFFMMNTSLTEIIIPQNLKMLPNYGLSDNPDLETVTFQGTEEILSFALCNLPKLKKIIYSKTLEKIEGASICHAPALEEVWFNGNGSAKQIHIAFQCFECGAKRIYCNYTTPPEVGKPYLPESSAKFFSGEEWWPEIDLYVPHGYKEVYAEAQYWGRMNIHEMNFQNDIQYAETDTPSITAVPGGIMATGDASSEIEVYTIDGKLYTRQTLAPQEHLPLPAGIYIVHTDGNAHKVVVK